MECFRAVKILPQKIWGAFVTLFEAKGITFESGGKGGGSANLAQSFEVASKGFFEAKTA